jgi:hypothetical protein
MYPVPEFNQEFLHLKPRWLVEGREGFVHEKNLGFHRE